MEPKDTSEVCEAKPIWLDAETIHHGPNTKGGRDFFVGNILDDFATIEQALEALDFDPVRDQLFSVGDLVDREAGVEQAITWLDEKRIKPVRGNHDQLIPCASDSRATPIPALAGNSRIEFHVFQ